MNDYESWINKDPVTVVDSGSLHFCLEYREVEIAGQTVGLTAKEFDILALLILNPRRDKSPRRGFPKMSLIPYDPPGFPEAD